MEVIWIIMDGERMNKKNRLAIVVLVGITILLNILILNINSDFGKDTKTLYLDVQSEQDIVFQMFYDNDEKFQSGLVQTAYFNAQTSGTKGTISFEVPLHYREFMICSNATTENGGIEDLYYNFYFMKVSLMDTCEANTEVDGTTELRLKNGCLQESLDGVQHDFQRKMNIVFCLILDLAMLIFAKNMFQLLGLVKELFKNRTMILRLGKNDFKTRFAGSYLGIIWAFIQPVVTVLVYWFVFQVGFRSSPVDNFPFVLWLTTGMVPWFFFSEAWNAGTNSLTDYSYLVKKVVFNISTIPVVKVVSALFVHVFFVAFMMFLYVIYGYKPDIYWLQVVYYSLCLLIMVLALSYFCSAVMVFFRDLSQIINVVLQVGIWLSCIMWSVDMLPERIRWVMYFNPIYYIVSGYRSALITKEWFWEMPYQTLGFWAFIIILISVGVNVFNKLRVHFADVL